MRIGLFATLALALGSLLFGMCAWAQVYHVVKSRRAGLSWSEALTNYNRLVTQSVWRDALLFLSIILIALSVVYVVVSK